MNCLFEQNTDGLWQCTREKCGWVYKFRSDKPPKQNCNALKETTEVEINSGPGTELKKILTRFGIRPGKNCKCERRARKMDQQGPKWCRENIDTIIGWLKEEANKRKLPFVNRLGKYLVNKAIKNSLKSGET